MRGTRLSQDRLVFAAAMRAFPDLGSGFGFFFGVCASPASSRSPPTGRSRTWPKLDLTMNSLPRYLLMVFALAGDSTMTSDLFTNGVRIAPNLQKRRFACKRAGRLQQISGD